jgi:hypothetical protein
VKSFEDGVTIQLPNEMFLSVSDDGSNQELKEPTNDSKFMLEDIRVHYGKLKNDSHIYFKNLKTQKFIYIKEKGGWGLSHFPHPNGCFKIESKEIILNIDSQEIMIM